MANGDLLLTERTDRFEHFLAYVLQTSENGATKCVLLLLRTSALVHLFLLDMIFSGWC